MSVLRRHPFRAALVALAVLAPAGSAASAQAHCANADSPLGIASERARSSATVCLINHERKRSGMRSLRVNRRLSRAALSHARDMVEQRYFSHVSQDGLTLTDRLTVTGYISRARRWKVGENLAWLVGSSGTPRHAVGAWMKSPGHRRNILDRRFRRIGVGVIDLQEGSAPVGTAYATTFGHRR